MLYVDGMCISLSSRKTHSETSEVYFGFAPANDPFQKSDIGSSSDAAGDSEVFDGVQEAT